MDETKREEYVLTITADSITSTESRFSMADIRWGEKFDPVDAFFERKDCEKIRYHRNKGERTISRQTLPRLTCQIFEKDLLALTDDEKKDFPIIRYAPDEKLFTGIFSSVEAFKEYRNSEEFLIYHKGDIKKPIFVIYCWSLFSTLLFVQECLKRFGKKGDQFILIYKEKEEK